MPRVLRLNLQNGKQEHGNILVFSALVIIVLLGFAAFAVDLGLAWSVRRAEQTAADTAVLAAAVTFNADTGTLQNAVDELTAIAQSNAERTITAAEWNSCSDADALDITASELVTLGTITGPDTTCISFSSGGDEVRTQLPSNPIGTSFASLIGINVINVSAAANATIALPEGSSSPPFVVMPGPGAGDQVCLRSSSSGSTMPGQWRGNGVGPGDVDYDINEIPQDNDPTQPLLSEPGYVPDPCDETAFASPSQFFGTLNPWNYVDPDPTSAPDYACTQTNTIDYGIAEGMDHNLSSFKPDWPGPPAPSPVYEDGNNTTNCVQLWPNTLDTQSGFTASVLKCGMIGDAPGGCSNGPVFDGITFEPRLQRAPYYTGSEPTFAGRHLENLALWDLFRLDITDATVNVPSSCKDLRTLPGNPSHWDYFDKKDHLIDCLSTWNASHEPLFDLRLLKSGRFAFIPQIAETSLAAQIHINQFVPLWFQKLYQDGNQSGAPDPRCFSQAEGTTGNSGWYWQEAGQDFNCGLSNQNVDRVAGIVLDCGMLPASACIPDGAPNNPGGDPVFSILLSR